MTRSARIPHKTAQRGVAAIEFAFMAMIFFVMLYGIATFGVAFYTQQVLARAAEDGARASAVLPSLQTDDARVRTVVFEALASSIIVPPAASQTRQERLAWLRTNISSLTVNVASAGQVSVRVVYPYRANPVLAPIPLTQAWLPTNLTGRATAALPTP
jgi:Flp pilus assembly protein TadG